MSHDFEYNRVDYGSPTKQTSMNNTQTNNFFKKALTGNDDNDLINLKPAERKKSVMNSIFSFFSKKTAIDSVNDNNMEYQRQPSKLTSMFDYDRSTNVNEIHQSLEVNDFE